LASRSSAVKKVKASEVLRKGEFNVLWVENLGDREVVHIYSYRYRTKFMLIRRRVEKGYEVLYDEEKEVST